MTDTCKCPPEDCHGGHTIQVKPEARQFVEDMTAANALPFAALVRKHARALSVLRLALRSRQQWCDTAVEQLGQAYEEQTKLRARITELEAEAQADERAIEEARDERDEARARVAELEAAQPRPELLGYLPSITRVGRCLEPGEHISPTETPIPDGVAVWMNGAPPEAGPIVAHATAVDGGCGWFVDTVALDGSRSDADTRCHSWMSDAGYRAMVVELRAVSE